MSRWKKKKDGISTHHQRWIRHKLGETAEEMAKTDGVSLNAIEKSIRIVDQYKAYNTVDALNETVVEVLLKNRENMGTALENGLTAVVRGHDGVPSRDSKGRTIPDTTTQLKALQSAKDLVQTVQPKPQRAINVKVNQQQAMLAGGSPPPESNFTGFEERLKMIRAKIDQHNTLPPVSGTVHDDDAEIAEEVETVGELSVTQG